MKKLQGGRDILSHSTGSVHRFIPDPTEVSYNVEKRVGTAFSVGTGDSLLREIMRWVG